MLILYINIMHICVYELSDGFHAPTCQVKVIEVLKLSSTHDTPQKSSIFIIYQAKAAQRFGQVASKITIV